MFIPKVHEQENEQENVSKNVLEKLTERQRVICAILKSNVPEDVLDNFTETVESLAAKLSVSLKTIGRDLKRMKGLGIIKREGGDKVWLCNKNSFLFAWMKNILYLCADFLLS